MSPEAIAHRRKYRHCRNTTLDNIDRKVAMIKQRQAENEACRLARLSWPRRVLSAIVRGWGAV